MHLPRNRLEKSYFIVSYFDADIFYFSASDSSGDECMPTQSLGPGGYCRAEIACGGEVSSQRWETPQGLWVQSMHLPGLLPAPKGQLHISSAHVDEIRLHHGKHMFLSRLNTAFK